MLRTLAKTMLVGAVRRGTGLPAAGPISAALLTTGASMALSRGRRPLGLALIAAGGLLLWREVEQEALKRGGPSDGDAVATSR